MFVYQFRAGERGALRYNVVYVSAFALSNADLGAVPCCI